MPNIKFSYLYRDGSNYKKFGAVVFDNPKDIDIDALDLYIRSNLIDGTWFYASKWQLPELYFDIWNNEFDHTFHEFESIEYTSEFGNQSFSLKSFIKLIECSTTI